VPVAVELAAAAAAVVVDVAAVDCRHNKPARKKKDIFSLNN